MLGQSARASVRGQPACKEAMNMCEVCAKAGVVQCHAGGPPVSVRVQVSPAGMCLGSWPVPVGMLQGMVCCEQAGPDQQP